MPGRRNRTGVEAAWPGDLRRVMAGAVAVCRVAVKLVMVPGRGDGCRFAGWGAGLGAGCCWLGAEALAGAQWRVLMTGDGWQVLMAGDVAGGGPGATKKFWTGRCGL